MGFLTKLFGSNKTDGINTYLKKGAILLDVRTKSEYNSVHLKNALHIPLQDIKENINKIKKLNKPVITYCQSGMRSRSAAKILRLAGINAINGGGILGLKRKLNEA
ncbi:rhodanese-like domain-containing protein [Winogradskyella sp.]|uniref:rhodanese-like domain-containing protein n=1 Tax=Winogradskyella sp. TaxID=1883156 RepID=UPI00261AD6D8|nr:rhodanese-like domain-containing protein [Winogradskyella sp.]